MTVREPRLTPVAIADLRPTQITVGMREVEAKRRHWRAKHGDKAGAFLASHMIPVVLGPGEHPYVIDHHHLARPLIRRLPSKARTGRRWSREFQSSVSASYFSPWPTSVVRCADGC